MNDPENLTVEDVLKGSSKMVAAFGDIGAGLAAFSVAYVEGRKDIVQTVGHVSKEQLHELAMELLHEFAQGTFNGQVPHTVNTMNMPGGMEQ